MLEPQETDEPPPPKRFGWFKALAIALAVLLLSGLIVYVNSRSTVQEELRSLLEELDRTEPGWRWDQMQAARPLIPDEKNAALQVIAFRKCLPQNWHQDIRNLQDLDLLDPRVHLNEEQSATIRQVLQKHATAVAEARKLAAFSDGRFPIKYKRDMFSMLLPDSQECRHAAQFLWYDLIERLNQGDVAGTVTDVRGMLCAARAHGDEPYPVGQMIRMWVRLEALRALERVLSRGESDSATLAALQAEFQTEADLPLLTMIARGDRAVLDQFFEALREGDRDAREMVRHFVEGNSPDHSFWERGQYWFINDGAPGDHVAALRYLTRFLGTTKLPPEKQKAAFEALDSSHKELPLMASMLLGGFTRGRITNSYLTNLAQMRAGVAAIAVERYRMQHGRWPQYLDDLAPAFLKSVPRDPFDGAPLRFRQVEHGVVIYSIGTNEQDDGGVLLRKLPPSPTNAGDYGFELWNPDQRQARQEQDRRRGSVP